MNQQQERALIAGLKALAATTRDVAAGPGVEAAVLAEMGHAVRPVRASRAWLGVAAALVLASGSGVWLARNATPEASQIQPAGFVDIPGTAYLPPMESGTIIRVALPITELPSYGIQIVPDIKTYSVQADLLIAQDGLARAIRLVNDSHNSRSTP
ncbi:MAG TPA: hypothetical protein VJ813_02570 [Vicinamibacterales bacterium]|nr:hypothetical protein [Vicinamibacterales bacterium]